MKLADQLGSFVGQTVIGSVKEVKIEFEGALSRLNVRPLVSLVIAGLLKPSMEGVNIVSAPAKAKELGMTISETKREKAEGYHTLLRVTVITDKGQHCVAGTVFGENSSPHHQY